MSNLYHPPESENLIPEQDANNYQDQLRISPKSTGFLASFSWVNKGAGAVFSNFGSFVLFALVAIGCTIGASIFSAIIPFIGDIAKALLGLLLTAGGFFAIDKHHKTGKIEVEDLFYAFKNRLGDIALLLLIQIGLYMLVGLILIIVLLMFISFDPTTAIDAVQNEDFTYITEQFSQLAAPSVYIPLILIILAVILPVMALFMFSPGLLILNKDLKISEALKLSFIGFFKNFFAFIPLYFISLFIISAGFIALIIGIIPAMAVLWATSYYSYRDIFLEESSSNENTDSQHF